jgi:hypothetical protein
MSTPALKIVRSDRKSSPSVKAPRAARKPKSCLPAAIGGGILGAFVPLAAHTLSHHQSFGTGYTTSIVIACLAYSAPTVVAWASSFTMAGSRRDHWLIKGIGATKALGFVVCLEGILVASPVAWLSWIALVLLMGINATVLGTKFGKR